MWQSGCLGWQSEAQVKVQTLLKRGIMCITMHMHTEDFFPTLFPELTSQVFILQVGTLGIWPVQEERHKDMDTVLPE